MRLLVIHGADTPTGQEFNAEDIHRWHKEKGWDGIGYHYVILINGTVEFGRPEYWQGAHVAGHNEDSLGICLIGEGDYTDMQYTALAQLVNDIERRYPGIEIKGHYELDSNKTCPTFDVQEWNDERIQENKRRSDRLERGFPRQSH